MMMNLTNRYVKGFMQGTIEDADGGKASIFLLRFLYDRPRVIGAQGLAGQFGSQPNFGQSDLELPWQYLAEKDASRKIFERWPGVTEREQLDQRFWSQKFLLSLRQGTLLASSQRKDRKTVSICEYGLGKSLRTPPCISLLW